MRPSAWTLYVEPLLGVIAFTVVLSTFSAVSLIADSSPNDFTVFMESARWLRQGVDIYQRPLQTGPGYNLNAPAAVLLFVPLSYLPDAAALRLWTLLAVAGYFVAAYWIAKSLLSGHLPSVAAALFLWQPTIMSLLLGQIGAALMLVVTAAWMADRRDRPFLGGVLLGAAIALKPFLAVLGVYALWRRSKAFAGGLCLGIAAILAAGAAAVGMAGFQSWVRALGQVSWTAHAANASLQGVFTRTLSTTPEVLHATPLLSLPQLVQPLTWVSVALIIGIVVMVLVRSRNRDQAWAISLIASLLVSPLGWAYYATMFAGPLLAVALKAPSRARIALAAGYACLLLPPMSAPSIGRLGILIFGSIYAWGFLLMFAGIAVVEDLESQRSAVRSQTASPYA